MHFTTALLTAYGKLCNSCGHVVLVLTNHRRPAFSIPHFTVSIMQYANPHFTTADGHLLLAAVLLCLHYLAHRSQQLRKCLCIGLINIGLDPSIFTTILQKHFLIYYLKQHTKTTTAIRKNI